MLTGRFSVKPYRDMGNIYYAVFDTKVGRFVMRTTRSTHEEALLKRDEWDEWWERELRLRGNTVGSTGGEEYITYFDASIYDRDEDDG